MARQRSSRLGALVLATAVGGWAIGVSSSSGAITVYPTADGTLRDIAVDGVLDGLADEADWYFNESSFEGAITLSTANPVTTLEDRVVWEYSLATVTLELPVQATLNFTLRGAPALPRPDVEVHVYAYDANLIEDLDLRDFHIGFSGGPAVFQGAVIVPPYQPATPHSINVSAAVNAALAPNGNGAVAFRFQVDPDTSFALNQAFIDALESEPTSKPFLRIQDGLPGDITGDGEVNLDDSASFVDCMAGPTGGVAGGCEASDLNTDVAVDLRDFQQLQSEFSSSFD